MGSIPSTNNHPASSRHTMNTTTPKNFNFTNIISPGFDKLGQNLKDKFRIILLTKMVPWLLTLYDTSAAFRWTASSTSASKYSERESRVSLHTCSYVSGVSDLEGKETMNESQTRFQTKMV
jgi:hypothetical protein